MFVVELIAAFAVGVIFHKSAAALWAKYSAKAEAAIKNAAPPSA